MPQRVIDSEFKELLQAINIDYQGLAKEHKAFERARQIKSADELMRMVLLYCGADESLRAVAGNMTLLGINLTDQSVMERLAKCQPWLQAVVSKMLEIPTNLASQLTQQKRLLIADMTDVTGPGAQGSEWRVHLVIDACSLQVVDINISDYHTVESLQLIKVANGDLIMADRAYCRRDKIFESLRQGAELVLRYNHKAVPVYDAKGNKINLINHFRNQARETYRSSEVSINNSNGEERKVWLHCYRLSKKDAAIAKKKCHYRNRKVKSGVSELTLFMSQLVVVLTSIPPTILSAEVALALYRCRWQVEIAIKRFKSLLNLDLLRTRLDSSLATVWLSGKMLFVLIMAAKARHLASSAYQVHCSRNQTPWRILQLLTHATLSIIIASQHWQDSNWPLALHVLSERRRNRKLQSLPIAISRFLGRLPVLANAS